MLQVEDQPIWIGAAIGQFPAIYPVVFQRENGFEPGHICQLDGSRWVSEVPYRYATLADALSWLIDCKSICSC